MDQSNHLVAPFQGLIDRRMFDIQPVSSNRSPVGIDPESANVRKGEKEMERERKRGSNIVNGETHPIEVKRAQQSKTIYRRFARHRSCF